MEMEMGLKSQGEYLHNSYTTTQAPPSPTSNYPPTPPTSDYAPPHTHYAPSRTRYKPPRTRYTPQRPRFHLHTPPLPKRCPHFGNQRSHVTATRRAGFRVTTRVEHNGSPRYVPPALSTVPLEGLGDPVPTTPGTGETHRCTMAHLGPPQNNWTR
jgi:hypothetical protein